MKRASERTLGVFRKGEEHLAGAFCWISVANYMHLALEKE